MTFNLNTFENFYNNLSYNNKKIIIVNLINNIKFNVVDEDIEIEDVKIDINRLNYAVNNLK